MKKLKFALVAALAAFALMATGCKPELEDNSESSKQTEENQKTGDDSSQSGESSKTVPAGFVLVPAVSINENEKWNPTSEVFASERQLEIASFYMCDHEVTQEEFKAVMGTNPSIATADGIAEKNPVNHVNWYDAITYCNKRSINEGLTPCYTVTVDDTDINFKTLEYANIPDSTDTNWDNATFNSKANGYRLPTEAEWEWAARGGENYTYAGSNDIDKVAWYTDNTNDNGTKEIKTKNANAYGLYDMSGNVLEWCWDWWTSSSNISNTTAVTGPSSGAYRILRGGGWYYYADDCTVSARNSDYPYYRYYNFGFRVVRSAQ